MLGDQGLQEKWFLVVYGTPGFAKTKIAFSKVMAPQDLPSKKNVFRF